MSKPVKLNELINEMEMNFDEYTTFYHPKTGVFYSISDQAFAAVEGDESMTRLHNVEDDEIAIAGDIYENSSDYIELPDRFEINEYAMLEGFSISVKDEKASRLLQIAIKGSGAFRRFKEMLSELDLVQEWYSFRDEQYKEKAIKWCQINELEYVE